MRARRDEAFAPFLFQYKTKRQALHGLYVPSPTRDSDGWATQRHFKCKAEPRSSKDEKFSSPTRNSGVWGTRRKTARREMCRHWRDVRSQHILLTKFRGRG